MQIVRTAVLGALALAASLVSVPIASADSAETEALTLFDWTPYAEVEEIEVLTTDADGDERETTIWLAVLDGAAYIRTGSTTWGDNVERDPEVALRIEEMEIPVRAHFIEDDALRERVVAAFREKYGFVDGLLDFMRGDRPRIMRVEPRP